MDEAVGVYAYICVATGLSQKAGSVREKRGLWGEEYGEVEEEEEKEKRERKGVKLQKASDTCCRWP